jgi:hypothetical protein
MNLMTSVMWSEAMKELHTELCEAMHYVTVFTMTVEEAN